MKLRIATMVLTLGLAALLAMPAFAQETKHRGGLSGHGSSMPMGGGAGLIANEGVQKELKLTDEQTSKAEAVARDVRAKHHDEFDKVQDFDAQKRSEKKALAVLSADQKQAWKDMTGEPFEVAFQGFPVFRRPSN